MACSLGATFGVLIRSGEDPLTALIVDRVPLMVYDEMLALGLALWLPGLIMTVQATEFAVKRVLLVAEGSVVGVLVLFLMIIQGRWVYPIPGLDLSSESLILLVNVYWGMVHVLDLVLAFGLFAAALAAFRGPRRWWLRGLALIGGVIFAGGSFPWEASPAWNGCVAALAAGVSILSAWGTRRP